MSKPKSNPASAAAVFCLLAASGANAQNLVTNGNFSAGLNGWILQPTVAGATTITHDTGVGNPAGSAWMNRTDGTLADNSDYLYQVIPVIKGRSYKFNAEWKGDLQAGALTVIRSWAEVSVTFMGTPTTAAIPFSFIYKKATTSTGPNEPVGGAWDWQSVLVSPNSASSPADGVFTATDDYMVVAFNVGGRAAAGPANYHVDNVSVTLVPSISSVKREGENIILKGWGPHNSAYEIVGAANLTQPVTSWAPVGTATFDVNGDFTFTKAVPANPSYFYSLHVLPAIP